MMETPFEEMLETMGRFNEELIQAGVLVAAEGLDDPAQGVVVDFSGETPVVTDGPYGETKELFGGFYLLDVASKEEAVEWAKRLPAIAGSKIEIRRVPEDRRVPAGQRVDRQGAGLARADRPALMPEVTDGPPSESARRAVEAVWRIESARIVGALTRYTGDFALAEDVGAGGGGRGAGLLAARRRAGQPGRLAAGDRPAAGDRQRSAAGPPCDERYALLAGSSPRASDSGASPDDRSTTCRGTPTGSTTTSSR